MIAVGLLFVRMLCDCFKSRRRLVVRDLIRRMSFENPLRGAPKIMASCSSWALRSLSPRFRSTWCPGKIGHCRPGRRSFAIIWTGLHRLISLWFQRSPLSRYYFFLPSGPNCSRKLHKSSASFSSLIPGNTILVPGIFALGSLMYSLKVPSSQTIPEFLFASE